ncbi:hypothetical protein AGDE_15161 [Angomonas deanei]|uniref:C2 domain containing protein, putative n=1 Tax=Angomonas deanei TaxID=59799 RepID=A0A7G2BZN4_9TRYP|nr:hypothetical protein AGDE_15161 [Angomonas deanei]CAD2212989.1 C2 domain containing protein, putative [Angomonas deanei]|eukprot:EPY19594.1 hypothetical protein AGDE_15161 [Angomonas deanei]
MKDIGSIGFKYTVMDLNLADRTRSRLVQDSIRHRRETKHLTHAAMAPLRTLSSVEREDTEKTDENGNRISEWRKRIAPRKFTLFGWGGGGAQKQNTAHAKTPSFNSALEGPSSDDQQSLVTASSLNGSDAGHRPAPLPTTNIMDDGIMGIEDFCSSNASSRMVSRVNSDDDFYEQQSEDEEQEESPKELTHSKTLEASSSTAWKVHARLRVRVLYCRNLFSAQRHPPNPYLAVSTLRETHCTSTQLATLNPRYNEEFEFSITEPLRTCFR